MQVPAGEPVFDRSLGNGQLLRDDLENSNASSGHARDSQPIPGHNPRRRSPLRRRPPGSASATNAEPQPQPNKV